MIISSLISWEFMQTRNWILDVSRASTRRRILAECTRNAIYAQSVFIRVHFGNRKRATEARFRREIRTGKIEKGRPKGGLDRSHSKRSS